MLRSFWIGLRATTLLATAVLAIVVLAGCENRTESVPNTVDGKNATSTVAKAQVVPSQGLPATHSASPKSGTGSARGQLRFLDNYAEGLAVSQKTHKPILLFFTAEWCHYCHQMAQEAFTDEQVVAMSDRFVCVLVDADASSDLCKQFRVSRFPTVQFVSARGVPLNRIEGKKLGHQVTMAMQVALQTVARRSLPGLPATR